MAEVKKNEKVEAGKPTEAKKDAKSATAQAPEKADHIKAEAPVKTVSKADSQKKLVDLFCGIGSLLAVGAAIAIFLNKLPKNLTKIQSFFSYFYILAIAGFLGVLGEQYSIMLLGFSLPVLMAGATILIKLKPTQFPIEDWWDQYSIMVLFSAGFLLYLYVRFDNLRKNGPAIADTTGKVTGSDGNLKARVDPALAAKYRAEMDAKNKKESASFDKALGVNKEADNKTIGVPGVAKAGPADKAKDGKADKQSNETNEERMEREVREMREEFNKRSMRLTTTLMRIKNLTKSLDRDQIFANTVEIITKGLDAKKVQLLLNDEKEGKLRIVKATGMKPSEYKNFEVPYEEVSMITHLLDQKINEVTGGAGAFGVKECEMDPQMKGLIGKGVLSTILAAPIYAEGKLFAILNVEEMNNPDYTRDDQNLLTTCADVAGLVMKNAKLYSATMDDLVSAQKLSEDQLKQNEQLRGLEFLDELIDSAIHHQPLRILYRSYYGIEHDTIVHPYHIKQFNNRWFLLGLEETENGNRLSNKALDRIVKFSRASVKFIPNKEIDFSEYFKDIVGVTVPKEHPIAETVILRFDPARFPYIVSKPIHPSQEVISEEEHTLQITVRPNKELEAQIFSYGPQVEVLEPKWLRQQIEEKIAETLNKYLSRKEDCTEQQ